MTGEQLITSLVGCTIRSVTSHPVILPDRSEVTNYLKLLLDDGREIQIDPTAWDYDSELYLELKEL